MNEDANERRDEENSDEEMSDEDWLERGEENGDDDPSMAFSAAGASDGEQPFLSLAEMKTFISNYYCSCTENTENSFDLERLLRNIYFNETEVQNLKEALHELNRERPWDELVLPVCTCTAVAEDLERIVQSSTSLKNVRFECVTSEVGAEIDPDVEYNI